MDNLISDFKYVENHNGIQWFSARTLHQVKFANQVVAFPFRSGTGILVVEPAGDVAPHNAIILDVSATIRTRIKNPEARNGAFGFCDAYYINDNLTLIIAFPSCQMMCRINGAGEVLEITESR